MSQPITATATLSAATPNTGRAFLAACFGAAVGLLLGVLVYFLGDSLATVLRQPHPAGYAIPAIVLTLYTLTGAGIACVMLPRASASRG